MRGGTPSVVASGGCRVLLTLRSAEAVGVVRDRVANQWAQSRYIEVLLDARRVHLLLEEVAVAGDAAGAASAADFGFEWGLDNWVHVANGDSGGTISSTRTDKTIDSTGRD